MAGFLREFSEKLGVRRLEGKIEEVNTHSESGCVESLRLDSGQVIVRTQDALYCFQNLSE